MDQNLGPIGLFLCAGALAYLFVKSYLTARHQVARPEEPPEPLPPDPLAPGLAGLVPSSRDSRQTLQQLLWTAGFYRRSALTEYLAVRAILVVGLLVATGLLGLLAPARLIPSVVLVGCLAAGLAFSLPRLVLSSLATSRARVLKRGLPVAMDVIGLCLTAGQNLVASLEITSRELAPANRPLAQELLIVYRQAKMHSLEMALTQWADRVDVPEIRSFVLLLVQSERLGTDMVTTLLEFADNQRTLLRQRAETQANRASFWMLFPSVFCLWVASAIILVGPAYIEFWKYRREQMNILLENARGQVERSSNAQTNVNPANQDNQGQAGQLAAPNRPPPAPPAPGRP